jgi:hypothetical protein
MRASAPDRSFLPLYMHVNETWAYFRLSRSKLYLLLAAQRIRSKKVGGTRLIETLSIFEYLDSCR